MFNVQGSTFNAESSKGKGSRFKVQGSMFKPQISEPKVRGRRLKIESPKIIPRK